VTGVALRSLLFAALALVAATLFVIDYSQPRQRILPVSVGLAVTAVGTTFLLLRSWNMRIARLRRLAESLPGGALRDRPAGEKTLDLLERSLAGVAIEVHKLLDQMNFESARRDAILSGMTEGVLAVDHELRVTFCNPAFLKAIGFRGTKFEGLSLLELARDPELLDLLREVLSAGEPRQLHFKLLAANARTFDVHATPLATASGPGAIAILHDTTDLERLEQIRKDFVANVSHELRTPLAGIIGYADTLLDGALGDAENNLKFIEVIRTNAMRLASLASDLLVLSELESGADGEQELISIPEVVDAVFATVESEARLREVCLIRDEIDSVYVRGSRLRLEQALLNVVANAVKFNRPGGEVRVSAGQNQDQQVVIAVADTGVGIASQDLARIFERFYRVDKARSRQVGGTGLGLSIVKHVMERMHGAVNVESQLGKGSTFALLLPGAPAPDGNLTS